MGKIIQMKDHERVKLKDLVFLFPLLFAIFLLAVIFFPVMVFTLFVLPPDTPGQYIYMALLGLHVMLAVFALSVLRKDEARSLSWGLLISLIPFVGPLAYLVRKWVG